jgi:Tfp pilus assembly protein PilN
MASKFQSDVFPSIDLVPDYIKDRQKFFKLQWHGFVLLFMILLTPAVANYYIQQSNRQIENLENEVANLTTQVTQLQPTVNNYNSINAQLASISDQIVLLDTLNKGTLRWSTNLDILNKGLEEIGGVWLTSMSTTASASQTGRGEIEISGIATDRKKIPLVADLFEEATLLDVTINQIREKDVYIFTYAVRKIVENTSVYSPSDDDPVEIIE